MQDTVVVALISLIGTTLGSIAGILAANRLVIYRIEQLEEKVARHNNLVERVYRIEARIDADSERKGN